MIYDERSINRMKLCYLVKKNEKTDTDNNKQTTNTKK